jgi:F-type H+-transporting ATPase subunit epsilon
MPDPAEGNVTMDSIPLTAQRLKCVIVTPERAVLDETADFVALTMLDGELGVAPGRAPLIGRLGFGELRTVQGQTVSRYYIDGGFAQVLNNVVTVLTPDAQPAGAVSLAAAEEALKAAHKLALTPEDQQAQAIAQEKARAKIHIAQKPEIGSTGPR